MPTIDLSEFYIPQAKQALLHRTTAKQILYGGAAGGGKSHALRWDAILFCLKNPGMDAYLFRRETQQLYNNHIIPIQKEVPPSLGQYYSQKNEFRFTNGSRLVFCHCEHENDVTKYQGTEIHWLGFDEAALFEPSQIIFLRSRVRLGFFASKIVDKEFLPRVVMTSNPGGPAHDFLKRTFMSQADPMVVFHDPLTRDEDDPEDLGWKSIFIPARMSDNAYLDKGYGGQFTAMNPEQAKALREGDWDVVEGSALHMLEKPRHMIKQFKPPRHWTHFFSMDWGSAKPFSCGWYVVVGENTVVNNNPHLISPENPTGSIFLPRGAVVRYKEWYGWNGNDDQGIGLDSGTVARGVLDRERESELAPVDYYIGDAAMMNRVDGLSIAERIEEATEGRIVLQRSVKNRAANFNEVIARLAGNPLLFSDGKIEPHPMFFITANCHHAWRTLPQLKSDKNDPDKGPGDNQEDHVYDEIQYALASRPFVSTQEDREAEYIRLYREAQQNNKNVDPYSTG